MSDISIAQVTTTNPTEGGVFDVLMRSVDSHLDKQYTIGRIKGSDYATVYLGALQAVLQQAIMFVLAEQKAEKEVDLLTQQILTEVQQTALVKEQHEKLEYETTQILPKQGTLLTSQNLEVIAGTARENSKATAQVTLLGSQNLTEIQSTTLTGNNAAKVAYETANILPKQALLIEQQELTETQQTAKLAYEVSTLLPEQLEQLKEQIDLLQSQDLEVIASTLRQDNESAKDIEVKDIQIEATQTDINTKLQQSSKDIEVKTQQITSMIKEDLVKDNQIEAIQADIAVKLEQSGKELIIKENQALEILANTVRQDSIADEQIVASNANTVLKDMLGIKQGAVYEAQADSFDKEAKYRVFKSLLDLRSTGMTQDQQGIVDGTGPNTGNALINEVLSDVGFLSTNVMATIDT
jgi:hypothetical protein